MGFTSKTLTDAKEINQGILALILIIFGVLSCFWGSKLFKQLLFMSGFVGAALFTYLCLSNLVSTSIELHLLLSCGVGIFVGIVCILIYQAAVLTIGGMAGVIVGQLLWQFIIAHYWTIPHSNLVNILVCLVCAIIFAMIAFKFVRFILKGVTAFVGSFLLTSGVSYIIEDIAGHNSPNVLNMMKFFAKPENDKNLSDCCSELCWVSIGIFLGLFVSGALYQYKCHPKHNRDSSGKVVVEPQPRNQRQLTSVSLIHADPNPVYYAHGHSPSRSQVQYPPPMPMAHDCPYHGHHRSAARTHIRVPSHHRIPTQDNYVQFYE